MLIETQNPRMLPVDANVVPAHEKGYDPEHFARLADVEAQHFWFAGRRKLIRAVVARIAQALPSGCRVIELGCGTGNILAALADACPSGRIFGMDLFHEGLAFARRTATAFLVQGDATRSPFSVGFDIVGAFDVLEHVENDAGMLREIRSLLNPGGKFVLTVPAYQWLWSGFDELSHHQRRYDEGELGRKLRSAGFQVISMCPFMMIMVPLMWWRCKKDWCDVNNRSAELLEREIRIVPIVNGVMKVKVVLSCESSLVAAGIHLPFGSSLLAVAAKS